ncbi:MAG: hypothetical protein HC826_00830 [Rhodospirillales bacterium]|nr:hypothetical protein [Rhodospirillales bacterium]
MMSPATKNSGSPAPDADFALLDDGEPPGGCWLLLSPQRIVRCDDPDAIDATLADIEAAVAGGLTAAGFFTYEMGYAIEPKLAPLLPPNRPLPLMRFGLFREAIHLTRAEARQWLAAQTTTGHRIDALHPSVDLASYLTAFETVRRIYRCRRRVSDQPELQTALRVQWRSSRPLS